MSPKIARTEGSGQAIPLNRSAYLVLGMIASGYATGYDISKVAEVASRFFWAAGDGQVYPQLKKLAEAGLIDSKAELQGRRRRNVYRLTAAGRRALQEWLESTTPPMRELRDEGLLQLFFSGDLGIELLRTRIDVIRETHLQAIQRLHEIEATARRHPGALLTQRHGLALHNAAVQWCDDISRELADADPAQPVAEVLDIN
jgi:PadR family transcriptional regulator AphA